MCFGTPKVQDNTALRARMVRAGPSAFFSQRWHLRKRSGLQSRNSHMVWGPGCACPRAVALSPRQGFPVMVRGAGCACCRYGILSPTISRARAARLTRGV